MATPANLRTLTPAEIDAELAVHYAARVRAEAQHSAAIHQLQTALDDLAGTRLPRRRRLVPLVELLAAAHAVSDDDRSYTANQIRHAMTRLDEADAAIAAARNAAAPYDAEFDRRGGWTRAFLVCGSGNGHVHSSMDCSTCNRGLSATEFEWVTDYSGRDQGAIIAAAGWRACTVCYPDAPVGTPDTLPSVMLSRNDKDRKEAAEQRAGLRAQKLADRIAKGLTADGSPMRVYVRSESRRGERYEEFKTERAATNWIVGTLADNAAFGFQTDCTDAVNTIVAAISIKHGRPEAEVRADIDGRVAAAIRRRR